MQAITHLQVTAMRKTGEERREEIIQAVLDLAAEQGVKHLTTQAIADRVGIAQPTVFRHFKTRDAILHAVMETVGTAMLAVATGVLAGRGPADRRLRQLLCRQLEFISRRRGVPRVLFSERLHHEDPGLKAVVRRVMDNYTGKVADLIAAGQAEGRFRRELDPREAAMLIVALIQGLMMRWSISDFALDLEAHGEAVWRLLEPALCAEAADD
jgi:TetR/AcrR family transcriptional regulator